MYVSIFKKHFFPVKKKIHVHNNGILNDLICSQLWLAKHMPNQEVAI